MSLSKEKHKLLEQFYELFLTVSEQQNEQQRFLEHKTDGQSRLTRERFAILIILVYQGSKTVNQIADIEQVSAPAITRIVKGLEKDGYVIKAKSKTDQRVVFVSATRKSKMLLQQVKEQSMSGLQNKLESFSEQELQLFSGLIGRLF